MDRKKFLKKASSGVIAATLLPLISFNEKHEIDSVYEDYKSVDFKDVDGEKWVLSFTIDNIKLTKSTRDIIMLKQIQMFVMKEEPNVNKTLYFDINNFYFKKSGSKNLYYLSLKINENKTYGDIEFAEDNFGEKSVLLIDRGVNALIYNKDLETDINFNVEEREIPDNIECFLTTACVFHKGFPDDCYELTTLRNLRKNIMNPDINYKKLISEYEIIAPKMLTNINNAYNKGEILDHIYENLVLPSVMLVESGENKRAILHYTDYVKEMKKLYL
ncbi:hypothetical protein [Frigoriflavimonas asaccharolytica]|uniref:Uncharacterized protein n=1 Tax=Frigoriflavimonas asaccharolytica TaxID=2735899 RepID=A0A8J8GC84_9FLAO|nr:hypothetical protein [Frigoriflavimonas asaccharolytica]NRS93280.1 hypothetical protein [Frigoriflavimonas asaccharolytica]